MVEKLGNTLLDFGGASTHARCFLHTTNLVEKALIRVFDALPKKRGKVREGGEIIETGDDESADEAHLLRELEELSEGIEHEDLATFTEWGLTDEEKIDDVDRFVDEIEELSDSKCQELLKSIWPIKLALVKVTNSLCTLSSTDFKHANRSTSLHSVSIQP
ncbi:hypothetical protein BS17DRAFT_844599 [Gyrodon lividus]|nr:hypothetical protein BS17DRAFT_844599 [Gyrodon lividus]